jgi:hypothetical protein
LYLTSFVIHQTCMYGWLTDTRVVWIYTISEYIMFYSWTIFLTLYCKFSSLSAFKFRFISFGFTTYLNYWRSLFKNYTSCTSWKSCWLYSILICTLI